MRIVRAYCTSNNSFLMIELLVRYSEQHNDIGGRGRGSSKMNDVLLSASQYLASCILHELSAK